MKNKKPYLFIFILIAFVILSLIGLEAKADVSGSQIRNQAISWKHLADSLRGTSGYTGAIAFLSSTGHVAYAETSAVAANGSVKTTAAFKNTLLDTIKYYLIDSTDVARLALTVVSGAIDDTNKLSQLLRDGLFGRNATPWVYYSQNALRSDSGDYSTRSGTSALADSALNVVSPDTVPYADVSGYSKLSGFADAATYATTAGSFTSTDTSITLIKLALSARDSIQNKFVHWADSSYKADSLQYGAFDSYDMFSSAIKSGYIPTAAQKLALAGITTLGGNPSVIYRYADSLYVAQNYVGKPYTAITGVPTNKNYDLRLGIGVTYNPSQNYWGVFDTTAGSSNNSGHHFTFKLPSKTMVFPDSLATYGKIAANLLTTTSSFYDYGGTGSATHNITLSGTTPSGGTVGDMWFDTTAASFGSDTCDMWVYGGTSWGRVRGLGTGGGGGIPTTITFNLAPSGDIDADSVLRKDGTNQSVSADSIRVPHFFFPDTTLPTTNSSGVFGISGRQFRNFWGDRFYADTIGVNGTATTDSLLINGKYILPSGAGAHYLGNESKPFNYLFFDDVAGSTYGIYQPTGSTNGFSLNGVGKMTSSSSGSASIGTLAVPFYDTYLAKNNVRDSLFVGIAGEGSYVRINKGGNIVVTNGTVAVTGVVSATGNISTSSGDLILNKNYVYNGATPRYTISENQWYAMDDACSPNDSNEVITRVALTTAFKHMLTIDTGDSLKYQLARFPRSFVNYVLRHIPSCQSRDSLGISIDPDYVNNGSLELSPAYLDTMCWRDTTADGNTWGFRNSVGFTEMDTSSRRTGMTLNRDWNDPRMQGKYVVAENGSDTLGEVTGIFRTIQGALNKIPYVRVRVNNSALQVATTGGTYGKHGFNPQVASVDPFYKGVIYMGNYRADSVKVNKIPDFFRVSGAWACIDSISGSYSVTRARTMIWHSIDRWANDSIYVFADTQAYRPSTEQLWVRIARPWIIEVRPPKNGAAIVVSTPIDIPSYAPVTIQGVGEKQTILINTATGFSDSTQPANTTIFRHNSSGSVYRGNPEVAADSMAGLPITIKNMTIVTRAGSTTTQAPLMVGGNVTLENLNLIVAGASSAICAIDYKGLNTGVFTAKNNSLLCQNVTVSVDTGQAVFKVESPLSFESKQSTYSIGASGGRIMKATFDMGAYEPRFVHDEIYSDTVTYATVPTYLWESTVTQTATKPAISFCEYIGRHEVLGGTSWSTSLYPASNIFIAAYATPPLKVRDMQKIYKTKSISPK